MGVFQRFYHYLELKSKHPDAAVPPLDDTLKKITEPDQDLLLPNKSVIDSFRRSFELKENPKVRMCVLLLFLTNIKYLLHFNYFAAKEIKAFITRKEVCF